MSFDLPPGGDPVRAIQQITGGLRLAINDGEFAQEDLVRRMGGVGLVLIDPRGGGVHRIMGGIHFGPGEDHEVRRGALFVQRIVRHQRNKHDPVALFGDQIQTVVKELAEEGHPAVEGGRQPDIRGEVRDGQTAVLAGTAPGGVFESFRRFHCRRVIGGLVGNNITDGARVGIGHHAVRAGGTQIFGQLWIVLNGFQIQRHQPWHGLVGRAVHLLTR